MVTKDTSTNQKYIALQALRGFAAALVVYVHALATYGEKIDTTFVNTMSSGLGELGVKIFFCISGFIIFNSSKNMKPGLSSVGYFLRRRVIRVAPIYWIATSIYALKLYLQGAPTSILAFIKSLLFIPYSNDLGLMRPVLGQGWTLNYEMFFYLLFGLGLLFAKTTRVFIVSSILISLMLLRHFDVIHYGVYWIEDMFFFLSENYLMYFLFGLFVGLLNSKGVFVVKGINETNKIFLMACILVIYLLFRASNLIAPSWLELIVAMVSVICLAICILDSSTNQIATFNRTRFNRLAESVGDASYSTYLTHGFVMGPVARVISLTGINISSQTFSMLMILVCTIFGIFFFTVVEKPLIKFLNSKFL